MIYMQKQTVVRWCSVKKAFLKISQNLQENNGVKKCRIRDRCFPVNFSKFLKTPFLIENLRWLLLYMIYHYYAFAIKGPGKRSKNSIQYSIKHFRWCWMECWMKQCFVSALLSNIWSNTQLHYPFWIILKTKMAKQIHPTRFLFILWRKFF